MSDTAPPPGQPDPEPTGAVPPAAPPPSAAPPPPPPAAAPPPPPPPAAPAPPVGAPPPPPPVGTYGAPAPAAGTSPWGELATWPIRVQSALVDWFGPFLVAGVLFQINRPLGYVGYVAAIAWALYNAYLGGTTGQSYGKKWASTRVVRATDGTLIGGGLGIGRYILHIVDSLPCYLGYLWPLWDSKRQTFADKIVSTVVVKV